MITSVVFVTAVALQKKFLLPSKFPRIPANMPKTYTSVLSTWGKYTAGFPVKSFGWCCGSAVLTGAYCWLSSNYITVQKIVSLLMELKVQSFSVGLRQWSVLSPLLFIVYIRILHTMTRAPNSTYEAISPDRKTDFANNEEITYLQKMCWFGRMWHIPKITLRKMSGLRTVLQ